MRAMAWVLSAIVGYVLGSVPVALIVARRHGVDLYRTGDGNPGAWNALEQLGPRRGGPAAPGRAAEGAPARRGPVRHGRRQSGRLERARAARPAAGVARVRRRRGEGHAGRR